MPHYLRNYDKTVSCQGFRMERVIDFNKCALEAKKQNKNTFTDHEKQHSGVKELSDFISLTVCHWFLITTKLPTNKRQASSNIFIDFKEYHLFNELVPKEQTSFW